ncbi:hypothetical protein ACJX0J_042440, partial [Zea mays]
IAWNSAFIGGRNARILLIIKGDILAAAMAHLGFGQIWCDIVSNLLASASTQSSEYSILDR